LVKSAWYGGVMPVNSLHPEYVAHQDLWRTLRDVIAGDTEIKRAGARYIARLEGQNDAEFQAYVDRGFFYNATARTVSGYLGMIFRREPVVKLPDAKTVLGKTLKAFLDDVDLLGKEIGGYAREVVSEVTVIGRAGTLIDWIGKGEDRAYWSFYRAEDILNWREQRIDGRLQLTLVVLREVLAHGVYEGNKNSPCFVGPKGGVALVAEQNTEGDDFTCTPVERIRVLRLVQGNEGWFYRVEIYGSDGKNGNYALLEEIVPLRRGKPLPNIPFVFHGPQFSKPPIEQSPISDIVAANLDHYRMNTDFKHGMHYTALPTAWVAGFEKDSTLRIGASTAWVTETIGATAGYLEFKGDGLKTFERAMDRVERLLSVLGARLLESQKRVSESAEALQLRQSGDSSVIAGLAVAVSKSLNQALRWVYWWHSTEDHPDQISSDQIMIEVNRDFDLVRLTGKEIEALVSAWQAMAISQDTLLHQFERGDVLPPGRSPEEELALIKANPPPAAAAGSSGSVGQGSVG
jgi:hypothetical protein